MDTLTLQALSLVCQHESTDELLALREEVKKLRKYKENVERNTRRLMDDLKIVDGMFTEVHNSTPHTLEEMLDNNYGSWIPSWDMYELDEDEEKERVKYYWERYSDKFTNLQNYEEYHQVNEYMASTLNKHYTFMHLDKNHYDYGIRYINCIETNHCCDDTLSPFEFAILPPVEDYEIEPLNDCIHKTKEQNKNNHIRGFTTRIIQRIDYYEQKQMMYERDKQFVPDDSYRPRLINQKTKKDFVFTTIDEFKQTYIDAFQKKFNLWKENNK